MRSQLCIGKLKFAFGLCTDFKVGLKDDCDLGSHSFYFSCGNWNSGDQIVCIDKIQYKIYHFFTIIYPYKLKIFEKRFFVVFSKSMQVKKLRIGSSGRLL